ncbi:rRNA pseudouridine synthase [Oscillospiraceae bacterium OttesenSCG-928-G22]|nr:rRNA pseudouridine synthase [Oscillospiraceae bacterium OttesenSCG-928-G22]
MTARLQKILSEYGISSRRAAEKMISDGRVTVNGRKATLGESADPERDDIRVDGEPIGKRPALLYIALYKPRGYVTTLADERGRKTVTDLLSDLGTRVYPAGRLDLNSEGLLLLTNDGELARSLMHPSKQVEKVYHVKVDSADMERVTALRELDEIEGEAIQRPEVSVLSREDGRSLLEIRIREGKNRQIRRMCEATGLGVVRLKRVAIGPITIKGLRSGQWRHLEASEVAQLKRL